MRIHEIRDMLRSCRVAHICCWWEQGMRAGLFMSIVFGIVEFVVWLWAVPTMGKSVEYVCKPVFGVDNS